MMGAVLPPARWAGPAVIVGLAGAWAVLWFAAAPPGQPAVAYLGQFFGAESVLLLSVGLVVISTLPWCEAAFDGIDRAAIWHRRVAITAMILLVPHIVLRAGELWHDHGLDFASTVGTPLTANNVIRAFRAITKKAGLGEDWAPRPGLAASSDLILVSPPHPSSSSIQQVVKVAFQVLYRTSGS
jgi:hypothetical protein